MLGGSWREGAAGSRLALLRHREAARSGLEAAAPSLTLSPGDSGFVIAIVFFFIGGVVSFA